MGRPSKKRRNSSDSITKRPLRRSARLSKGGTLSPVQPIETQPKIKSETTTLPKPNAAYEDQDFPYEMELAITPPQQVAAGRRLEAPLVVTFRNSRTKKRAPMEETSDLSGIWAYVSLMSEDRRDSPAPPQKDLLRGSTSDSIHELFDDKPENGQPFAYATFPNLTITRPGRYRFRFNIIDMNRPFEEDASSSIAKVLSALDSDVFDVVKSEKHSRQNIRDDQTVSRIKAIEEDRERD